MNNVVNETAIEATARRLAGKIPHERAAKRFTRLAFDDLRHDARNFHPATERDMVGAAPWAVKQYASGRTLHAFKADRTATARLRRIAKALADTCDEISERDLKPTTTPDAAASAQHVAAKEFVEKMGRASLAVVETKARLFARLRKTRLDDEKARLPLFAPEAVDAGQGRVWTRIVSLSELWEVGREFSNCLTRSSRHIGNFARRLRSSEAEFWVLRDRVGKGLMVVMSCIPTGRIAEARGPRNAPVPIHDPDLAVLAKARGWRLPGLTPAPRRAPLDPVQDVLMLLDAPADLVRRRRP